MDVSVVIVSYNAASYLKECVESILKFTEDASLEIIIVDNNSPDNSVEVARSFGNKVMVIANKENHGFGAGVNVGLKKATGRYILVLNPDIVFLEDSISKMIQYMEGHAEVGLAGCTLLEGEPFFRQGEQKMLPNGGYFPTLTRLFFWSFFLDDLPILKNFIKSYHPSVSTMNRELRATRLYLSEFFPDWVTGSFMFVRKEVIEKVGMLDENIFMYGEEVEWQYRIGLAGWKVGYTPVTKVIHYERQSSGGLPRNAILGEFRGLKYIYGKHFPGWKQIVLGSLLDIVACLRIIFWLVRRKREMAKIYLEALAL